MSKDLYCKTLSSHALVYNTMHTLYSMKVYTYYIIIPHSAVGKKVNLLHISVIKWVCIKKPKCLENGHSKLETTRKIKKMSISILIPLVLKISTLQLCNCYVDLRKRETGD